MSTRAEQIAHLVDKQVRAHRIIIEAYQVFKRHMLINGGEASDQALDACTAAIKNAEALLLEARADTKRFSAEAFRKECEDFKEYSADGGPDIGSTKCNVGSGFDYGTPNWRLTDTKFKWAGALTGRVSHDRPNGEEIFRETIRETTGAEEKALPDISTMFDGTREVQGSGHDPCLMRQKHSPDDRYVLSRTPDQRLFFVPAKNGGWRRNVLQVDAAVSVTVTHVMFETVSFSVRGQRFINAACLDDGTVLRMFAGRKS